MDEAELVRRLRGIRDGTADNTPSVEQAMELLFDQLYGRLVAFSQRYVGDSDVAAEVAQDALLTAWTKLGDFEGRSRFSTWVMGIARNKALDRNRKHTELLVDDGVLDRRIDHDVVGAYGLMRSAERGRVLLEAISGLPDQEQEALYMRYSLGLPVAQITVNLGLDQKAGARGLLVKSRRHLNRALREILQREGLTSSFLDLQSGAIEGVLAPPGAAPGHDAG